MTTTYCRGDSTRLTVWIQEGTWVCGHDFCCKTTGGKDQRAQRLPFCAVCGPEKAYDSVPRQALWCVLEKCGVPPTMLHLIRSFHEDMRAEVRIGSVTTDIIQVQNGLRQGCCLAPALFNIYFSAVVANWRELSPEVGVNVMYKHGRKLVGDRTRKSRLSSVKVTESQFADDAAVYATNRTAFEQATRGFVHTSKEWGLTVSTEKTKGMVVGQTLTPNDVSPLQLGESSIEVGDEFSYLGSNITSDGELKKEVQCRIGKAARAFGCLRQPIFSNSKLSVSTKRAVYQAVVLATLLYGAETWTVKAHHLRRLNVFHNRCIRTILGVTKYQQWKERISSRQLSRDFGMEESIADIIMNHLGRMEPGRIPKQLLFGELEKTRPKHGTKRRWRDVVSSDLQTLGIKDRWYQLSQDRQAWFQTCTDGIREKAEQQSGRERMARCETETISHSCPCGRTFRRQGDLTRHSRFCSGARTTD